MTSIFRGEIIDFAPRISVKWKTMDLQAASKQVLGTNWSMLLTATLLFDGKIINFHQFITGIRFGDMEFKSGDTFLNSFPDSCSDLTTC